MTQQRNQTSALTASQMSSPPLSALTATESGWSVARKLAEQKVILTAMMAYLPETRPTLANNNTAELRFLLREWPTISQTTLHTAAILGRLKLVLLSMGIPHIKYQVLHHVGACGMADYTPAGITMFQHRQDLGIHNNLDMLGTNSGGSTSEHTALRAK